jgi:c-di-GMP-binding flagellar brake protein YcgR
MENNEERRQYARIQLCAYGVDTVCIVMHGEKRCHLDLVDISSGGARLRSKEAFPEFGDGNLIMSVHGIKDEGRLQNLPVKVRWKAGQEIGVQFLLPVDMGLSELQRLIS